MDKTLSSNAYYSPFMSQNTSTSRFSSVGKSSDSFFTMCSTVPIHMVRYLHDNIFCLQDNGGSSIDGPVMDAFYTHGAGFQYLSLRNKVGAAGSLFLL